MSLCLSVCSYAFKPPDGDALVSFTAARSFNRSGGERPDTTRESRAQLPLLAPLVDVRRWCCVWDKLCRRLLFDH